MASVSVEFDDRAVDAIFKQTVDWYKTKGNAPVKSGWFSSSELCWTGLPDLFETYGPVRPFGLGAIRNASNPIYGLAGRVIRTPGFYHKVDPETARIVPHELLKNTNERIHNSVRVRLACGGLGLDDSGPWACEALAGKWKLDRARADDHIVDPIRPDANWWPKCAPPGSQEFTANLDGGQRWVWRWAGPQYEDGEEPDVSPSNGTSSNGAGARRAAAPAVKAKKTSPKKVPLQKILVEEPSGPYERYLLYLGEEQRKSLKGSVIEVAKNKDWKGSEWLHPNCS